MVIEFYLVSKDSIKMYWSGKEQKIGLGDLIKDVTIQNCLDRFSLNEIYR